MVYIDGKPDHKVGQENLVDELESKIRAKAKAKEAALAAEENNIIVKSG